MANMSTMCILLYLKLIWYNGFPKIYAEMEKGHKGQSVMKLMQCSGLPDICATLEERGLPAKYECNLHSAINETYLVYWFSKDVCSIGGGGGVSLS